MSGDDPSNLIRMIPAEEEVHIRNATLAYNNEIIFSNIHFELLAQKWTSILGPSGVGKSSFLKMIAGLVTSQSIIEGNTSIAYMAQTDLLLPWLTVLENTTLGLKLRDSNRHERHLYYERAVYLLSQVGLKNVLHLYPRNLSGGMRQRVALVRTLLENKEIILMDEPFSALDAITRFKLQELAMELLKDKTVLLITHDPTEALRLSHFIYVMQGRPAQLKLVADLPSVPPRTLSNSDLIRYQAVLFNELSHAATENNP